MSHEHGGPSSQQDERTTAEASEAEPDLVPAASVRAPKASTADSGSTTLLVWLALLVLIVVAGLRLAAH